MLSRRHFILCTACTIAAMPAVAADASARAFVAAIYAAYQGENTQGISLDSDAVIKRYFAPPLAALMIKDMNEAAKRKEVGALDGDPFIDAHDWVIASFEILGSEPSPGKPRATVKFVNLGTPTIVMLDLVKVDNAWRIDEITWRRDGKNETLSSLFAAQ